MAFTMESLEAPQLGKALSEPSQFDLPSKEFVGYDPKGTQSVTGSPLVKTESLKQAETIVAQPAETPAAPQEESVTLSSKVSAFARKEQAQRQKVTPRIGWGENTTSTTKGVFFASGS